MSGVRLGCAPLDTVALNSVALNGVALNGVVDPGGCRPQVMLRSESERLGPTSHLAALTDAQLVDRTARERVILGEQPGQQFHIVETAIAQDRDRATKVRGDALVREQLRRDHPDDGIAAAHGDELSLVDESAHARDLHVQVQRDIGEGKPVRDEFVEGIHGTRVPRLRSGAHPAGPSVEDITPSNVTFQGRLPVCRCEVLPAPQPRLTT